MGSSMILLLSILFSCSALTTPPVISHHHDTFYIIRYDVNICMCWCGSVMYNCRWHLIWTTVDDKHHRYQYYLKTVLKCLNFLIQTKSKMFDFFLRIDFVHMRKIFIIKISQYFSILLHINKSLLWYFEIWDLICRYGVCVIYQSTRSDTLFYIFLSQDVGTQLSTHIFCSWGPLAVDTHFLYIFIQISKYQPIFHISLEVLEHLQLYKPGYYFYHHRRFLI